MRLVHIAKAVFILNSLDLLNNLTTTQPSSAMLCYYMVSMAANGVNIQYAHPVEIFLFNSYNSVIVT